MLSDFYGASAQQKYPLTLLFFTTQIKATDSNYIYGKNLLLTIVFIFQPPILLHAHPDF